MSKATVHAQGWWWWLPQAGICDHVVPLEELSAQAGLLAITHSQLELLVGLCNTSKQAGSKPVLPSRAVPLVRFCDWSGLWAMLHNNCWSVGTSGCAS